MALLLFTSPAPAQVYQWEDEEGTLHMTDDLKKIPEKYREGMREIVLPDEETEEEEAASGPAGTDAAKADLPTAQRDNQGHDREWWQARVNGWRQKKGDAERKLAEANGRLGKIRRVNPTVALKQEEAAVREEIRRRQGEIKEAERMLKEQLPEEARKAEAPPGWLRE